MALATDHRDRTGKLCSAQSFGGAAARLPGSNDNDRLLTCADHLQPPDWGTALFARSFKYSLTNPYRRSNQNVKSEIKNSLPER
jgi:hypothetical protein